MQVSETDKSMIKLEAKLDKMRQTELSLKQRTAEMQRKKETQVLDVKQQLQIAMSKIKQLEKENDETRSLCNHQMRLLQSANSQNKTFQCKNGDETWFDDEESSIDNSKSVH